MYIANKLMGTLNTLHGSPVFVEKSRMPKRASSIDITNVLLSLGWYYPEIHRGVARFARDQDWHVTADFDDPIPAHWQGDGVIALLGARHNHWPQLRRLRVPVVDLAESRPNIRLPRVTMDNFAIGRMAAEHFLESGYRHFAACRRWELGVSRRRCDAFQLTVNSDGHDCELMSWQRERGDQVDTRQKRHRWLMKRLSKLKKPVALFAVRDVDAVEVIEACAAAGISVPDEVAVLGVDNNEMICDCLRVPLSSIDPNLEEVGYQGAALLSCLLSGKRPPLNPIYIAPIGIVRRRSSDGLAVEHSAVAAALRFIHDHAHEPIRMVDVTAHVEISRSGLEKAFREHFVRAPMEELRRVRLQRAMSMLRETDLTVTEVAEQAGFQTAHSLCRNFRQHLRITPGNYRTTTSSGST